MSLTTREKTASQLKFLNEDELEELQVLLAEAESRGIQIDDTSIFGKQSRFPIDTRGYFSKEDGRQYEPMGEQEAFIDSKARFVAFIGGRGSGKTAAGAQKALRKIAQGESGAVMNPDFENFRYSTWPEFRRWIPWEMVITRHQYIGELGWQPTRPFSIMFKNGAEVYCKGLKDANSARGPNINWLWYDEGGRDLDGMGWKIAFASVRIGEMPQSWTTSTPNGMDHWLNEFFVEREIAPEVLELFEDIGDDRPITEIYYGSIDDNKANLDAGFYATLRFGYVGWMALQELEGQFVNPGSPLGDWGWFDNKIIKEIPDDASIAKRVRYWDLAATERKVFRGKKMNDPDETVGTLFSWDGKKGLKARYFVEDQVGGHWKWSKIKKSIWETALKDGHLVRIVVEEEPGSGGKNQVEELKLFVKEQCRKQGLPIFKVEGHKPEGDKVIRANTWYAESKNGQVYLLDGLWLNDFKKQFSSFPIGRHDDRIDSVSGARLVSAPIRTWRTTKFLHV